MGRRSRKKVINNTKTWNVGVYLRVSVDDKTLKESSSISSQRKIAEDYLQDKIDMQVFEYYIDDGYSGLNFKRPAIQRLLNDIVNKKVNTIIVKDLSRFGRNYLEVGNYLEQIFPLYNLRFIAIDDKIDSYLKPDSINNIFVSFKNLMNEEYAKDISNKIKSALKVKQLNGEYMGGIPLFGYKVDPINYKHLIIDEEEAKIIRKIFDMCINGYGVIQIVKYLNDNNIPTSSKKRKGINTLWCTSQVRRILRKEEYTGITIRRVYKSKGVKDKKTERNPKEDWIITDNPNGKIISKETFKKAGEALDSRYFKRGASIKESIYKNILKCGDCKKAMSKKANQLGYKYYYCSTYKIASKECCGNHEISELELNNMVLKTIKFQISLIIKLDETIDKLINDLKCGNNDNLYYLKQGLEKELSEFQYSKKKNYENWKLGTLNYNEYTLNNEIYNNKIVEIASELEKVNNDYLNAKQVLNNNNWIGQFKKYKNITELNRECLYNLIDKIYVYEGKNIEIQFKYMNEYNKAINFVSQMKEGDLCE